MGERGRDALRLGFDGSLKLEFHVTKSNQSRLIGCEVRISSVAGVREVLKNAKTKFPVPSRNRRWDPGRPRIPSTESYA